MKDLLDDTVADLGAMVDDEIVLYEQDCKDLSDNFEEFINVSDNRTERLTEINKGFISNIKKLLDKSNEKKLQMEIEKLQEKMLEDVETAKNEMHHLKKESELLVAKIKNEHKHSMDDLKSMIENKTKELKRIAEKLEEETLRFQQRESDFHQKFRELENCSFSQDSERGRKRDDHRFKDHTESFQTAFVSFFDSFKMLRK